MKARILVHGADIEIDDDGLIRINLTKATIPRVDILYHPPGEEARLLHLQVHQEKDRHGYDVIQP